MRWLLLLIALLVGLANSQEPSPSPAKGSQKPQTHAKATAKKSEEDQRGTEKIPFVIRALVSEKSKEEAAKEAEDHERKATFERWDVVSTVVIAIFTVILGISTILLWRDTSKLSKLARDEFLSTHRPKIRIKHVWITSELWRGKPIDIELVIVNTGIAPAFIRVANMAIEILPKENQLSARPVFPCPDKTISIPKVESGITVVLPKMVQINSFDKTHNDGIRNGSYKFYCFGYVEYEDSRHGIRKTAFCRVLRMPTGIGPFSEPGTFEKFDHPDYEYQD
jgi:hypothetical protein